MNTSEGNGPPPPQAEKLKSGKGSRPRSEVAFPYYSLDGALDVPKAIHTEAGGACSREQLAPLLGYSGTKNGGFLSRVGAARMFGLVEEVGGLLRPTNLATQILSPVHSSDAQRGKVAAFMNVDLFLKVYDRFKGQALPSSQGMENLFRTEFKIVPGQVKNALRNLMESAETAGFFDAAGRGRLVLPLSANAEQGRAPPPLTPPPPLPLPLPGTPLAGGSDLKQSDFRAASADQGIPPAIYGLIRDLPEEGTAMTGAKRERLIKAFEASINWLYPDADEEKPS